MVNLSVTRMEATIARPNNTCKSPHLRPYHIADAGVTFSAAKGLKSGAPATLKTRLARGGTPLTIQINK